MRILLKICTMILVAFSGVIGLGLILFSASSIYEGLIAPKTNSQSSGIGEIIYSSITILIGMFMVWFTPKLIRWGGEAFDSFYEQMATLLQSINRLPKQQENELSQLHNLNKEFQKRKV